MNILIIKKMEIKEMKQILKEHKRQNRIIIIKLAVAIITYLSIFLLLYLLV